MRRIDKSGKEMQAQSQYNKNLSLNANFTVEAINIWDIA